MHIVAKSADEAFIKAICQLYIDGDEVSPRGLKIREKTNALITIKNPLLNIVDIPLAKVSKKYLIYEFIWYLLGSQDRYGAQDIVKYAKFWGSLLDPDGSLNSNYGYYIFDLLRDVAQYNNKFFEEAEYYLSEKDTEFCCNTNEKRLSESQFDYCLNLLAKDKDTRQAVININQAYHKLIDTKDFPCTIYIQFFIRNNKLNMTVNMRSCDIRLGFCNDVFQFTMIQEMMYTELLEKIPNLEMGEYTLFCGSLHLYERHFPMAKRIIETAAAYMPNENNLKIPHKKFGLKDGESLSHYYLDFHYLYEDYNNSIDALTENAESFFEVIKEDQEKEHSERLNKHNK